METTGGGEGDPIRQLSYVLVFGVTMLVVRRGNWLPAVPVTILCLFGWCWLSLLWAIEPSIAFRRAVLTSMIAAVVFASIERAGTDRAFLALSRLLLVALVVNYLAIVVSPGALHLPGESTDLALVGNWRGATLHKNVAGAIAAITVLVLLWGPRRLPVLLHWGALLAAAYFLWRTQSKTSMAMLALALVCASIYLLLSPRLRRLMLPATMVLVLAGWALFGTEIADYLDNLLAQPDALTGRAEIWPALLSYASNHIWLGSGYGSFWDIGAQSPILDLGSSWVANLLSGHNGYLDVLVQIGAPGLVLAVIALILAPLWRLTRARNIPARRGALLLAMLVFSAGHNLSESSILARDLVVWVMFLVAVALTAKLVRESAPAASRQPTAVPYATAGRTWTARAIGPSRYR
ncbi:MAG: O-antigen ligase family protein [Devosia sp.]|nr:O-antigen ligase family protein [Devosia sp.]